MDELQEGDKIWVEMPEGEAAAAVYVGEAELTFGGVPSCYVVYADGQGAAVEMMRVLPREDSEQA